jgi:hypothetical protein
MFPTAACAALLLGGAAVAADDWDAFWKSVDVSPAPPRDFLEGRAVEKIRNLTVGRLSDATVKQWVLADLRRGRGDGYAYFNLRDDIADAGIFGPPGLNGTGDGIAMRRAAGVVRITGASEPEMLEAGVIWISPQMRKDHPGFTEYAIVLVYRMSTNKRELVFADGHKEALPRAGSADEIHWQLDTGHFVDHPTLGPLWYQLKGWTCYPDDGTATGEICGRIKPHPST